MQQRRVGDWWLVREDLAPRRPIAIDPPDCGCNECQIGEYVPLDMATDEELEQMRQGHIRNNTGYVWIKANDPHITFGRN